MSSGHKRPASILRPIIRNAQNSGAPDCSQQQQQQHGRRTKRTDKHTSRSACDIASPYSITERMVPELVLVLGSKSAGDVSHKPNGRLPLLSARPAVTLATLKRVATNFAAW